MDYYRRLSEGKIDILQKFRSSVEDILTPETDSNENLIRWLIARDFDLSKAEAMIRNSVKHMYNIEAVNTLENGYEPYKYADYYLPSCIWGFDDEGSIIRCFLLGVMDFKGFCRALSTVDVMKFLTWVMQKDINAAKENAKTTGIYHMKIVYVFDMAQFSIMKWLDKTVIKKGIEAIRTYQDNFPEMLKVVYLINTPPYFETAMNIFKPFINERTFNKFKFYSTDSWRNDILQHVDNENIPRYYGGTSDKNSFYTDPTSFLKETSGGKIPVEYYLKDESYLKTSDPEVQSIIIQDRVMHRHKITVEKCGTRIKWIFQTKNNNIKFGVCFTDKTEDSMLEIIKPYMVDSHVIPEKGEIRCDNIGTYFLQFDNTHSWLSKKELLLKVSLVN